MNGNGKKFYQEAAHHLDLQIGKLQTARDYLLGMVTPAKHHHAIPAAARKRISAAKKQYWAKRKDAESVKQKPIINHQRNRKDVHWTQRPENKDKLQKILRKMNKAKAKKAA